MPWLAFSRGVPCGRCALTVVAPHEMGMWARTVTKESIVRIIDPCEGSSRHSAPTMSTPIFIRGCIRFLAAFAGTVSSGVSYPQAGAYIAM
jgi:hypothetical protein